MELGALICTPRSPQCLICPVKKLCVAFKENRQDALPHLGKREAATRLRFVAFVVETNGCFLVRQRPAGAVNAQLWEFPNSEVNGSSGGAQEIFQAEFGLIPKQISPLVTLKHSITRYRITLEAFAVSAATMPKKIAGVWKSPAQLERLAFTSAHRKILRALNAGAGR